MIILERINSSIARFVTWVIELFYIGIVRRFIPPTTYRYLACGVGNYIILDTLLYFCIYHYVICERYIDLVVITISPHISSMCIVFPLTFMSGFWLNRYVAFKATEERAVGQIIKYAISICGSIVVSYIVLKFLVEYCGVWATPAKALSSIITAIYSYMAARFFTFRR